MVVLFPNTRAIGMSKGSMLILNCADSCVLAASDSKGSPVDDGDFHAIITSDVPPFNPNLISIIPSVYVSFFMLPS